NNDGIKFSVGRLGFRIGHQELNSKKPFWEIEREGLQMYMFQHAKLAKEHYPEFRLVADVFDEVYETVSSAYPEFLHPNRSKVTLRPWGAMEFALRDDQVCVIIQQW